MIHIWQSYTKCQTMLTGHGYVGIYRDCPLTGAPTWSCALSPPCARDGLCSAAAGLWMCDICKTSWRIPGVGRKGQ